MNFKHHAVSLEKIDFEDHTFCLSFPCRAMNLIASLDLVGVIHPPVLREGKRYQIVCGRGRLEAAKELGLQEITCKVLPQWVDDLTCLMISFEENITTRGFNLVEKALVVEKFQNYLPDQEIIENLLPRLGFHPSYKHFEFLQKIAFLEEEAKEMILEERLDPKVAVKLLDLNERERKTILDLYKRLSPTASRQRQIFELLQDLCRREGKGLMEILEDSSLKTILQEEKLDPRTRTERFYQELKARVMPTLKALEDHFRHLARHFSGPGLRLEAPPGFEKTSFKLEVEFKDLSELKEKVSSLWQKLTAKGDF